MSEPALVRSAELSTAEIPIDPTLLAEDAAAEEQFEAEQEAGQSSDEGTSELNEWSGAEDDYAPDDQEDEQPEAGPSRTGNDDAVFEQVLLMSKLTRLAGFVSRAIPSGASGDLGGRDFQREIALADAEELPQPARRRRIQKPRRIHKPSHEVTRLLGQANFHNLNEEFHEAIEIYLEVIRHDPYISAAWASLATCYEDLGDPEKARQMRFLGAHIDNDEETWKELAYQFKQTGQQDQCVYCLRKALKFNPSATELLFDLGIIYVAQRQKTRASDVFRKLVKTEYFARHFDVIMEFHQVMIDMNQRPFVVQVMREAFDWHIKTFDAGPGSAPLVSELIPNTMTIERVIDLVDDFMILDDLDQALEVVRKGQRWLQGRKGQKNWDNYDKEDREYDPPQTPRYNPETKEMEDNEGFELDVQLRHRLALIRLRLGDHEEAMIHVNEIQTLDVLAYHALFVELGEALMKCELWDKALDCYASIQECEELPDSTDEVYNVGICHHQLRDLQQAQDALQWVVDNAPDNIAARLRLANVLEDMGKKSEALDLVSDIIRSRAHREKDKHSIRRPSAYMIEDDQATRAERSANKKLTKRILEDQMRSQMQNLWKDVQDAERGIEEGDIGALDRFISAAGTMIENYRLNRGNFSKSRGVVRVLKSRKFKRNDVDYQAREMQDRLERVLGFEDDEGPVHITYRRTEFYGLNYEEWLTLTVKYCCVLMVKSEEDIAMDILEHVIWSGLFHNRRCEVALRLTMIACGMRLRAYDKITDSCKRLAQMYQFDPSPLLLMLNCISSGGLKALSSWGSMSVQNFVSREMKTFDDAVSDFNILKISEKDPSSSAKEGSTTMRLHYSAPTGRWAVNRGGKFDDDIHQEQDDHNEEESNEIDNDEEKKKKPDLPKKPTAYWYILHGQQMLTNKSYQSALFYLFRAYELDQYHPFICLLIAQSFFGRAMNRQSDNRNYQLAQGMAFLTRYRKLSSPGPITQEQVEYNYGRSFHGIGINHLAVSHYERVLKSIEKRMENSLDPDAIRSSSLAYQSAHNLILLYAISGNHKLIKEKSKWLAI
ncbi:hypothetical protein L486_03288 [Kwoniella mangroviensis CBS 10435]|uniref:General transcription factor 3C polypeptide 3 (Transcription factor C subunit 4) n=1 Tax=Kwoniella mangroviensis CBS 10435 TaxID=1331196 RepID=A0A1B9ITD2_9TREE|nr:hypothetical protein L486_03288 [Kwoniella mangroviensis CBS 10435]